MTGPPEAGRWSSGSRRSAGPPLAALLVGYGVVLLVILATAVACVRAAEGHFVYVLDDPYIGMAMARSLATHGSWGVNPGLFEPAASSPLWILLMGLVDRVMGVHALTPLVLDAVALGLLLAAIEWALRPAIAPAGARVAAATAITWLAPAVALAMIGLEHAIHAALALVLSWTALRRVFAPPAPAPDRFPGRRGGDRWDAAGLVLLAAATTLTRFETVALIAALAVVALLRRRPAVAGALLAGAALAVGGYAAVALSRGGMWLPSSVLIKTPMHQAFEGGDGLRRFAMRIPRAFSVLRNAHLLFLSLAAATAALALPTRRGSDGAVYRALLAVVAPLVLIQVQCGEISSFFRYDSWLVVLGLTGLTGAGAVFLAERRRPPAPRPDRVRVAALAGVTLALLGLLAVRVTRATAWAPLASRTIYEQQYQMARFVRDQARGWTVALVDVGAVAYYGESEVVDMAGLAALPVARAALAGKADAPWLATYCAGRGARVAILYESWLGRRGGVPSSWRPLTRWAIRDNFAAAGDTVTVYCTSPGSADEDSLRAALRAFEPTLPARVARVAVPQ